jgi:hypothetical protein
MNKEWVMHILDNLKKGLLLALQSFGFIFRYPWLMLYAIIPAGINLYFLMNILFLHPNPFYAAIIEFILQIMGVIGLAAFIYHANSKLEGRAVSISSLSHQLSILALPLLFLSIYHYAIHSINSFLIGALINQDYYFAGIYLRTLIAPLWFFLSFYVLVLIVVEKTSFFRSFLISFNILGRTWIRALFGVVIIWLSIWLFIKVPLHSWIAPHVDIQWFAYLSKPFFAGLALTARVFVLLLYRDYKENK